MIHSERPIFRCAYCGESASRKGRFLENHYYCSWACELKEVWVTISVLGIFLVIGALALQPLQSVIQGAESSLYEIGSVVFLIVGSVLIGLAFVGYLLVRYEPK